MVQRSLRYLSLLLVCSFAAAAAAQKVDIRLANISLPPVTAPGALVNVYASYTNTSSGPNPAKDFMLTMSVPPGTTYEGYLVNPAGNPLTCAEPPKGGRGDLVCSASSLLLLYNNAADVDLVVSVDPTAALGTVITFPVTLTSSNALNPSQAASASVTVVEGADLNLEMSAPASAAPGDTYLTTITVTNRGPGPAIDPYVTYSASSGGYMLTAPPGWTCPSNYCTIDSFPPGTATFIASTIVFPRLTSISATAQTWAPNYKYFREVTATTAVGVPPPADVAITVDATPASVQTGDVITYTLTAKNGGPSAATDVTAHLSLPSALRFLSASPGCTGTSNVICKAGALDKGTSAAFTVTSLAVEAGSFKATASVSTSSSDPNSHNNSGSATIIVNAPAPTPARRRAARH